MNISHNSSNKLQGCSECLEHNVFLKEQIINSHKWLLTALGIGKNVIMHFPQSI